MTKINKKNQPRDMHTHTAKAYALVDQFLPNVYVGLVQEKFEKKFKSQVSSSVIRNVKNKTNYRNDILLVLVEVALENKKNIAQINNLINQ